MPAKTNPLAIANRERSKSISRTPDARFHTDDSGPITSVARAFRILEFLVLADTPKSVAAVSRELRLAPSTTHRFLTALVALGFVNQDQSSGYRPTLKLFNLGSMVMAHFRLSERLLPTMRRIAEQIDEAVSLVIRESFEGLLLERVEATQGVQVFTKYRRVPLYCTAAGKAILAALDENALELYLSRAELKSKTQFTLTNPADLRREVERIRHQGFAIDNQELEMGARCVAVPLMLTTEVIAALSVSALAPRMGDRKIREIASIMKSSITECGFSPAFRERQTQIRP